MEKNLSDMLKVSARGSMILMIGQMGSTLIAAIGNIIIARFLGSTSFGIFSIALIPISLSLTLIYNGVGAALIHFLAKNRYEGITDNLRNIVFAGYSINVFIGFLTSLSLFLLAGFLSNTVFKLAELELLVKILSVSILAESLLNTSYAVFAGFEKMTQRSILSITHMVLKSFIGPLLIYLGYGVIGVAIGYSLSVLLSGIIGVAIIGIYLKNIPSAKKFSLSDNIPNILRYSYPLFLSNVVRNSILQVFSFILPFYVTATVIGNYSAAKGFSFLIAFFTVPIATATFPLLSKINPKENVFEYIFQSVIKYQSMVIVPIVMMIIAVSDNLVEILYGGSYYLTPLFLRILMIDFLFVGFGNSMVGTVLSSQNATQIAFRKDLIYLVLGIPMGLFLIPRFGVIGLQFTLIVAPKFGLLYMLNWVKNHYDISIDINSFIKVLFSSSVSFIICIVVMNFLVVNPWMEMFLCGISFFFTYLIMILVTGVLVKTNIEELYTLTKNYEKLQIVIYPLYEMLLRFSRN